MNSTLLTSIYKILFYNPIYLDYKIKNFTNYFYTIQQEDSKIAEAWFDQAIEYWKQAITLTLENYIEAQNWLRITRRFE